MSNIEKLPKWAQNEIASLKRELSRALDQIENLKHNPEEGDFYYQDSNLKKYYLPSGINIYVPLETGIRGEHLAISRSNYNGKNRIDIRTGHSSLNVEPQASNAIACFAVRT